MNLSMPDEQGQRVVAVLQAEGPTLPVVVLARLLDVVPTRLAPVLDDLYEEGVVAPGHERGTVALVPQARQDGRFQRSPPATARAPR